MINEYMINEVKKRLIHLYDPIAIYIFGSYAWGSPSIDSDLDILVVIDSYKKDRFKAIADAYRVLKDVDIGKDILVYTKDEFEKYAMEPTTFCHKIAQEGKKIYAKTVGLA